MTIRNLSYALQPRSVALIGASERPLSVGHKVTENLLSSGFAGPVYLVNPQHQTIEDQNRIAADPDYTRAEFAVIVRSDLADQGIGSTLMRQLIRYAAAEGLSELYGEVLGANTRMLDLCRELGFTAAIDPEYQQLFRVRLPLKQIKEGV